MLPAKLARRSSAANVLNTVLLAIAVARGYVVKHKFNKKKQSVLTWIPNIEQSASLA